MKHILKVTSLQNLPETRPIIVMDNEGNLFGEGLPARPTIEMVDLGLSVKWAKCNLGAETETDYGDYYAWGEVKTKNDYAWETYTRHTNGTYSNSNKKVFIKYCYANQADIYWASEEPVDNLTALESVDDVAIKILGGNWKMPNKEDFNELLDTTKVTNAWVTKNGVNGREFTSLINGNTLFLPAAGYYDGSSVQTINTSGNYWSSNLINASYIGMSINFHSTAISKNANSRYRGCSIRPVFQN